MRSQVVGDSLTARDFISTSHKLRHQEEEKTTGGGHAEGQNAGHEM